MIRICILFPLMMGLVSVHFYNNSRGYLICSNREEFLRYNLQDFWDEINYEKEHLNNLPGYHPFNMMIYIICESFNIVWKTNFIAFFAVSANFALVPISYLKIVLFLRMQNKKIGGIATHNRTWLYSGHLFSSNKQQHFEWTQEAEEYCLHRFQLACLVCRCSGWYVWGPLDALRLSPGHEPEHHLQLRPDPRHLPHRGPGILQQGQQLRREEHDAVHCVSCHGGEGGQGCKLKLSLLDLTK